ncbi:hypothetical protein HZC08_02620 [Candidatus Micrarchaeota archaeon]|nr:hypothetical protein [Candidatus Micrarchaeota archaeon]
MLTRRKHEASVKIPGLGKEQLSELRAKLAGLKGIEPESSLVFVAAKPNCGFANMGKTYFRDGSNFPDGIVRVYGGRQSLLDKVRVVMEIADSAGIEDFNLEILRNLDLRRDDVSTYRFARDFPNLEVVGSTPPFMTIASWNGTVEIELMQLIIIQI